MQSTQDKVKISSSPEPVHGEKNWKNKDSVLFYWSRSIVWVLGTSYQCDNFLAELIFPDRYLLRINTKTRHKITDL